MWRELVSSSILIGELGAHLLLLSVIRGWYRLIFLRIIVDGSCESYTSKISSNFLKGLRVDMTANLSRPPSKATVLSMNSFIVGRYHKLDSVTYSVVVDCACLVSQMLLCLSANFYALTSCFLLVLEPCEVCATFFRFQCSP